MVRLWSAHIYCKSNHNAPKKTNLLIVSTSNKVDIFFGGLFSFSHVLIPIALPYASPKSVLLYHNAPLAWENTVATITHIHGKSIKSCCIDYSCIKKIKNKTIRIYLHQRVFTSIIVLLVTRDRPCMIHPYPYPKPSSRANQPYPIINWYRMEYLSPV